MDLTLDTNSRLKAVVQFLLDCDCEAEHSLQVARLSLRLFDELEPLHRLDEEARFLLHCGALLHDIGWEYGQRAHHKSSLNMIQDSPELPFDERERLVVASIARYHRKALPKQTHQHFASLSQHDQDTVCMLAGMVRVADGLDRTHRSIVRDITCSFTNDAVILACSVAGNAFAEKEIALEKGVLLEQVLGLRLIINCDLIL
jgi:exopolyphosphatase/guanosine-5'-triphosphate,3'-diphosphate pyrophosphatase